MMSRRLFAPTMVGVLISVVLGTMSNAVAYELSGTPQDEFEYCYATSVTALQKDRFENAIDAWTARVPQLEAVQHSCSQSAALTVHHSDLGDGSGGLIARVDRILGDPQSATFDSAEDWWVQTSTPECDYVDFWGTASHEVGHIWGLGHMEDTWTEYAPEGDLITMSTDQDVYSCPEIREDKRELSSDDEAGAQYVSNGQYLPNPSFENSVDCSSTLRCTPSLYWDMTGSGNWERNCENPEAVEGDCVASTSSVGAMSIDVLRRPEYQDFDLSLQARYRGFGSTDLEITLRDVTGSEDLRTRTCTITGQLFGNDDEWQQCSLVTGVRDFDARRYEIIIERTEENPPFADELWIDDAALTEFSITRPGLHQREAPKQYKSWEGAPLSPKDAATKWLKGVEYSYAMAKSWSELTQDSHSAVMGRVLSVEGPFWNSRGGDAWDGNRNVPSSVYSRVRLRVAKAIAGQDVQGDISLLVPGDATKIYRSAADLPFAGISGGFKVGREAILLLRRQLFPFQARTKEVWALASNYEGNWSIGRDGLAVALGQEPLAVNELQTLLQREINK
jgi:hypothetical protein